jgi:hypothetical protein
MADDRRGFQGPRLLADAPETHAVRLHSPEVMRRIASQAYFLWTKRGRPRGNQLPDWIAAEETALGLPS